MPSIRPVLLFSLLGSLSIGCESGPEKLDRRFSEASEWEAVYPELVDLSQPRVADRFRAIEPTQEQSAQLDKAVLEYTDGTDAEFTRQRDVLAAEPVTAFWVSALLAGFVAKAQTAGKRRGPIGSVIEAPVWERPTRHLKELGAKAVPAIAVFMLRDRNSLVVELGGDLLAEIGPVGFPRWEGVLQLEDDRAQRRLYEVLAGWSGHSAGMVAAIERGLSARQFGVRGAAYRALASVEGRLPQVYAALESESDPFVRREIAKSLGGLKQDRAAGVAVVGYLARARAAGEDREVTAAVDALRSLSGKARAGSSLELWQAWLADWQP